MIVALSGVAQGQAFSPGPLSNSHVSLDNPGGCNECHISGTGDIANDKCLGCHEHQDLAARIAAGKGLHGSGFARKDCERCHKEHKGRGYDLMGWAAIQGGEKGLDHALTGWPLQGKHAGAACNACHTARNQQGIRTYLGTDPSCGACHKSPHDGHLFGTRPCEGCHVARAGTFKTVPFDHGEQARVELGAHKKLACYGCHTRGATPVACEACHAGASKHGARFGAFGNPPACATCHSMTRWTSIAFDHSARTKFPLVGKHSVIGCRRCHRGTGPDFEDLRQQILCKDCHEHRKVHADVDHPDGKYTSAQCLDCHPSRYVPPHGPEAFLRIYHGPSSSFPLVKGHRAVPCADCHQGRSPRGKTVFERESPECGARCHVDTLHQGSLGMTCTPCHTSGTWAALKFDHGVAAYPDGTPGYALRGEHRGQPCEACHGARRFKGTPRACAGCHAKDDAHQGRLGARCERCHLETGDNLFNHNAMSAFRLDGAHLQVRCADCHPSVTFKPRPRACSGCHPDPAVHRGQYGAGCQQCHSTRTWADVKPLHDVGDFALRGQHVDVPCERCHRDHRPLGGSGNLCINCHRRDDIHNNSLSPRCGECHTQWSFAPARFDHGRVGCNLTGLHRTLACFDCHRNGNFAGLTAECTGCHMDDAAKLPTHTMLRTGCTTGATCHNPSSWTPSSPSNRESVCR